MIRLVGSESIITKPDSNRRLKMADFDEVLDASGLNCPLPILRAKKALNGMESGKVLRIIATDPGSVKDFEAFAKQTGNELMESTEEGGKFMFLMKKG
jgi:tRNA 2-thiouridine synthesizing protein A